MDKRLLHNLHALLSTPTTTRTSHLNQIQLHFRHTTSSAQITYLYTRSRQDAYPANITFQETYGLLLTAVMKHEDLAIGNYRRAVSGLIARMTTVALVHYKHQIEKEHPGFD